MLYTHCNIITTLYYNILPIDAARTRVTRHNGLPDTCFFNIVIIRILALLLLLCTAADK